MSGFGRNKEIDTPRFRGQIPDNTTIPVVLIENHKDGAVMQKLKNGASAGKTARIYKPVFECIKGKYSGARVYGDIWCNVEIDSTSGDAIVFGSHAVFCDLCDATDVHDEDGAYPVAANATEANAITQRMVGKLLFITVGIRDYQKKDGTTGYASTVKSVTPMTEEQKATVADEVAPLMARVAKQHAKRQANQGGSGLEDMGIGSTAGASIPDDDGDMPF